MLKTMTPKAAVTCSYVACRWACMGFLNPHAVCLLTPAAARPRPSPACQYWIGLDDL